MTTAAAVEIEGQMTPGELVQRFIADMTYDAHSAKIRFLRSEAQRELVRRGKASLSAIADQLELVTQDEELRTALCMILDRIQTGIGPGENIPDSTDVPGMIAWARSLAT